MPLKYDTPEVRESFWKRVDKRGPDECWNWTGFRDPKGYGRFRRTGVPQQAHRASWEMANQEPLGDRFACHHCDNTSCVNPAHLYAGDRNDNARDYKERGGEKKSRKGIRPHRPNPFPKGDWFADLLEAVDRTRKQAASET